MSFEEFYDKWKEKITFTKEEVEGKYKELMEDEKQLHPNQSDEFYNERGLRRLMVEFKRQLISPAVAFEGVVLGQSDIQDIATMRRNNILKFAAQNQEKALRDGMINENGVPLDTTREFKPGVPNPRFGQPLPEHSYLKRIYGVANLKDKEEKKWFNLLLRDNMTELTPDECKDVVFRAILSNETDTTFNLNGSTTTEFETKGDIKETPKDLIGKYCKDKIVKNLVGLEQFYKDNEKNFERICFVEASVVNLGIQPTTNNNYSIHLADDSLDVDKMILGYMPTHIYDNIDFSVGSTVIIMGSPSRGKKRDDAGNYTDEPGDIILNVYGIYCSDAEKIPVKVKEMKEENIKVGNDKEENEWGD